MKKDYQCNSINHEMFKIKKAYCKKCIYFDEDNFKCTQNKIYKKCFKNDERIMSSETNVDKSTK